MSMNMLNIIVDFQNSVNTLLMLSSILKRKHRAFLKQLELQHRIINQEKIKHKKFQIIMSEHMAMIYGLYILTKLMTARQKS